jgi:hypothetical protein
MLAADSYRAFLASKRLIAPSAGIDVDPATLHPAMREHQRRITAWALRKGKAAVWCDTGLGKALIAMKWAQQLGLAGLAPRTLILAPLSVAQQFVREGEKWGIPVVYAKSEAEAPATGIVTSNYERLDRFDAARWPAVVLDESSVLKTYTGKTKQALIAAFRDTRYKLCCTATPAPNDTVELCNHAAFLGVMSQQDMLATFFISKGDDQKSNRFRLKNHARKAFYAWLSSWAVACTRPSDLTGEPADDAGYVLPPLDIRATFVPVEWTPPGQLFLVKLKGVTERAAVRRDTVTPRAEAAAARINGEPDERWIAWYGRLDEAAAVAERVPGAVIVQGKDSAERKESVLRDFAEGRLRVLVTHCDVAGFGMNFQACARQVFVGLSDSYEAYYQAIRRSWRFGQTRPVHAHIVLSEPERAVYDNVLRKEAEVGELTRELVAAMRDFERAELGISKQDTEDRYAPTRPLVLPAWLRSEETQEGVSA